jgi:hypothetical protein
MKKVILNLLQIYSRWDLIYSLYIILCVHTVVNLSVAFAIFQQPFVCLIKELDNLGAVTKSHNIPRLPIPRNICSTLPNPPETCGLFVNFTQGIVERRKLPLANTGNDRAVSLMVLLHDTAGSKCSMKVITYLSFRSTVPYHVMCLNSATRAKSQLAITLIFTLGTFHQHHVMHPIKTLDIKDIILSDQVLGEGATGA